MGKNSNAKRHGVFLKTSERVYHGQVKVYFENMHLQTDDEKFLSEIVDYIRQNISNPDLSVEKLSHNMKISRAWLYKKLLLLTGKSPIEFIRSIRLQKAVQLLENPHMKISWVAGEVGFETPQYFTKLFKKEYHILPSAYMLSARKAKAQVVLDAYGLACTSKKAVYYK